MTDVDFGGPSADDLAAVEADEETELVLELAVTGAAFSWYGSDSDPSAESALLSAVEALVEHRLFGLRGATPLPFCPPGGVAPRCGSRIVGGVDAESGEALTLFDSDRLVS